MYAIRSYYECTVKHVVTLMFKCREIKRFGLVRLRGFGQYECQFSHDLAVFALDLKRFAQQRGTLFITARFIRLIGFGDERLRSI